MEKGSGLGLSLPRPGAEQREAPVPWGYSLVPVLEGGTKSLGWDGHPLVIVFLSHSLYYVRAVFTLND